MKKFSLLLIALFTAAFAFAQEDGEFDGSTMAQPVRKPVETPWTQVNTGEFSEPVPFAHQRQADVMYYHVIWRRIDLRDKKNHPLYFPVEVKGTWRSLAQTIFDAIDFANPDNVDALPIYNDEFCTIPYSREEVANSLTQTIQQPIVDPETGDIIDYQEIHENFEAKNIMSYNIKEVWFFDKQTSKYYVRILELEPILEFERNNPNSNYDEDMGDEENVRAQKTRRRLGHIYYEELRPFLVKQEVFNTKNNAQRLSYDDLITFKRDFNGYIYAEDNVYDRQISEYIANARDQMIESERITEKLRTYESDLWEF
ncbi:MAG: gliding motility protein GldN [Bacteroidales bacterium]|nr:gliding motility protein GldN [Bacteroidales bacterium]MBR6063525.1 gliding motility protein GldN [Bacteroidales bacterium]